MQYFQTKVFVLVHNGMLTIDMSFLIYINSLGLYDFTQVF
jgi:hypothetical protein